MKIILTTLNSKFIHSNLAIRYLEAYTKDVANMEVCEFTINQSIDYITAEIFKKEPNIIGFSTYIWNLKATLQICKRLKLVMPNIKIILGGPEVSFDSINLLKDNPYIDFIIRGEGEETFKELIRCLTNKKEGLNIDGLVYRSNDEIIKTKERKLIKDLGSIPSPYDNIGDKFENRIVYYESSRGCPFNCEFCLSSTIKGVRFHHIDRVKNDLGNLIDGKVSQVKFVDRTFNANKGFAMEIMKFIIDKDPKDMNFHFEVTAHLLDEEMLKFLETVKEGLFQFEIGVQSTNEKTIDAIGRTTDFNKLKYVSERIKSYNNIHQHLDLIAGLPYEDYNSFKNSFNDVYEIKPEKIQLGFLKLLKGSGLRLEADRYGYKYINQPPYEILENKYISYKEIIRLKAIENLVERYYDANNFEHSLEFIIKNFYTDAFSFYEDFADYWDDKGYNKVSHSKNKLYKILLKYCEDKKYDNLDTITELIRYDYIMNNHRGNLRFNLKDQINLTNSQIHNILKEDSILENYLKEYIGLPTKRLIHNVKIESFNKNLLSIIERGYIDTFVDETIFILFKYTDGELTKCRAYDITEEVKELI